MRLEMSATRLLTTARCWHSCSRLRAEAYISGNSKAISRPRICLSLDMRGLHFKVTDQIRSPCFSGFNLPGRMKPRARITACMRRRQDHLLDIRLRLNRRVNEIIAISRRASAQWHSLWFVWWFLWRTLFLCLVFALHELCGFLSSRMSLSFVSSTRAIRKLVFGCDAQSVGVT